MTIGNDVVDLSAPEARGKARDARFVRRVFTEREAAFIRAEPDPDRALWTLWASKEAAFKVLVKLGGPAVFSPHALEVCPTQAVVQLPSSGAALPSHLHLRCEQTPTSVHALSAPREITVLFSAQRLHVGCALGSQLDGPCPLTPRELASARAPQSRRVRVLAKQLAYAAGLGEVEIVRDPPPSAGGRFGPPRLYLPGAPRPLVDWDLSLSHDGELVSAALLGR